MQTDTHLFKIGSQNILAAMVAEKNISLSTLNKSDFIALLGTTFD